jgi:hypothetical protein
MERSCDSASGFAVYDDRFCSLVSFCNLISVRPTSDLGVKVSTALRTKSELFTGAVFTATVIALVAAPILAAADIAGSYLPWAALRLWMVGFAVYGFILARQAGGLRRLWQGFYAAVGFFFAFVYGLEVEEWALIDLTVALLVGLSALFLRTEPSQSTP